MPERVIRNGRVEIDPWHFLDAADPLPPPLPPGGGGCPFPLAVSLPTWKEHRESLLRRDGPAGVWLSPDDDPAQLEGDLAALALVAVHFPKFTDGRGYSTAALLRARYGYRGELRAFGDVGRDQLFYLARCGFDSFALPAGRDPYAALPGFHDFTVKYQAAAGDPLAHVRGHPRGKPSG